MAALDTLEQQEFGFRDVFEDAGHEMVFPPKNGFEMDGDVDQFLNYVFLSRFMNESVLKIGYTSFRNLPERYKNIKTYNPGRIQLLAINYGHKDKDIAKVAEIRLHTHMRLNGHATPANNEWFMATPEAISDVMRLFKYDEAINVSRDVFRLPYRNGGRNIIKVNLLKNGNTRRISRACHQNK